MSNLSMLLEREEAQRDQALQRLQQAEALALRAHAQATMLLGYRDQYHQRWSAQFARGGSMPIVQCYQGFVQRLQQAIVQQQHDAAQAAARLEQCRAQLQAQQRRVASVRKLIERRQHELRRAAERREQKAGDEAAARAAAAAPCWDAATAAPRWNTVAARRDAAATAAAPRWDNSGMASWWGTVDAMPSAA